MVGMMIEAACLMAALGVLQEYSNDIARLESKLDAFAMNKDLYAVRWLLIRLRMFALLTVSSRLTRR